MYTFERRHLIKLGSVVDPAASQFCTVPLMVDEPVQYLACWVYSPGEAALGGGSLKINRHGEVISTTAFSGNSLVVPLNIYTVGADFELELIHPQTSVVRPLQSVWNFDSTAGVMVEDKNVSLYGGTARPMSVSCTVTNTDATKKDLIVMWTGLIWRNV